MTQVWGRPRSSSVAKTAEWISLCKECKISSVVMFLHLVIPMVRRDDRPVKYAQSCGMVTKRELCGGCVRTQEQPVGLVRQAVFYSWGTLRCQESVNDGGNGTILKAVSAVQAVLLMDDAGTALVNRFLRTDTDAFSTADTGVCDEIPFRSGFPISDDVALPEDGIHPQVEILDGHVPDAEDNPDAAGIPGIDIGQIGLFLEDQIPPLILLLRGAGFTAPVRRIISLYMV